jgi:hypothetical protein
MSPPFLENRKALLTEGNPGRGPLYISHLHSHAHQLRGKEGNPWVIPTRLSGSRDIHAAGGNGLIKVDITVADLDVEPASGVDTYPGFVVDRRPLTAVVRQRHQLAHVAFLTLWHHPVFHVTPPYFGRAEYITGLIVNYRQI